MTHKVNCPYKNHESLQKLPCDFILHPYNKNLMFCQTCGGNEYDIRDIGEKTVTPKEKSTEDSFWPLMGVILVLLIGLIRVASQPKTIDTNLNPSVAIEQSRLSSVE